MGKINLFMYLWNQERSVSVVTRLQIGCMRNHGSILDRHLIFLVFTALNHTQPPIQWILRACLLRESNFSAGKQKQDGKCA